MASKGAIAAGQTTAVVAVLAAGGYLLFRAIQPLGDSAENVAEGAENVTAGVKEATTGAPRVGSVIGAAFGGGPGGNANEGSPTTAEFSEGRGQLGLRIVGKKDDNSGGVKRTSVTLQALLPNGQGAAYAEIQGAPVHSLAKAVLGSTFKRTADSAGFVSLSWQVGNVPGTDVEDDIVFHARKAGYNPSPGVRVT